MLRRRSLRGRRGRHSLWILWSRRTQMVLAFERTLTVCRADRPYSFSAAKTCLKPPFSSFMAFEWPFDVCGHCTKWCFVKIHIHKPDISWILYIIPVVVGHLVSMDFYPYPLHILYWLMLYYKLNLGYSFDMRISLIKMVYNKFIILYHEQKRNSIWLI